MVSDEDADPVDTAQRGEPSVFGRFTRIRNPVRARPAWLTSNRWARIVSDYSAMIVIIPVMLVPGIFTFNLHEKLLIELPYSRVSLLLFGLLGLFAFVFAWQESFDRYSLGIFVAFASPILHAWLFRRLFAAFKKRFGRAPIDVVYNWSPGLFKDRAFAMAFVLGSIFASMAGVGYFHWGIAIK